MDQQKSSHPSQNLIDFKNSEKLNWKLLRNKFPWKLTGTLRNWKSRKSPFSQKFISSKSPQKVRQGDIPERKFKKITSGQNLAGYRQAWTLRGDLLERKTKRSGSTQKPRGLRRRKRNPSCMRKCLQAQMNNIFHSDFFIFHNFHKEKIHKKIARVFKKIFAFFSIS